MLSRKYTPGEKMSNSQRGPQEDPAPTQRTVAIHTHGCKLNQADSQLLAQQFHDAGFQIVGPSAKADVVVLNTCTVTSTADAKARQFLRAAGRRSAEALVVATGCYAQRSPAELESLSAVSLVVGNTGKQGLVNAVRSALLEQSGPTSGDPGIRQVEPLSGGRTRAMVKIQEGCDQVCAYCIVPKVRGRERSIPSEDLIAQINRHSSRGCREVVLTGTQLGSYGFELPGMDLQRLLERVLSETTVERVRVSSLQAHEFTPGLLALWQDSRLLPHFHIPLQSGCDRILARMRRRYDTAQFSHAVAEVRRMYPDASITTDLIVGFPGEKRGLFSESRDFVRDVGFSDIHVFPYSPRPGTSAFHFNDAVDEQEKRDRMSEILALSADSRRAFKQSQLGSVRPVLWERNSSGGSWSGLTDNYVRVRALAEENIGNCITEALLVELEGECVMAEVRV